MVEAMGERYLWVDSPCIIQDAKDHKHDQISQMDSVYSQAIVTIFPLSSKDDNECFMPARADYRNAENFARAVEHIKKEKQIEFQRPVSEETVTPLVSAMADSTYETRGWWFRERILSRRLLYITNAFFSF